MFRVKLVRETAVAYSSGVRQQAKDRNKMKLSLSIDRRIVLAWQKFENQLDSRTYVAQETV